MRRLDNIRRRSPHLAHALERVFDERVFDLLEQRFAEALRSGGDEEIGFSRKAGVSYNPCAARIALIALDVAELSDPHAVAAAMLLSAQPAEVKSMSSRVDALLELALQPPAVQLSSSSPDRETAAAIALAYRLDRMRHFHQSSEMLDSHRVEEFLREYQEWLKLAEEVAPAFVPYFESWHERFVRQRKR